MIQRLRVQELQGEEEIRTLKGRPTAPKGRQTDVTQVEGMCSNADDSRSQNTDGRGRGALS